MKIAHPPGTFVLQYKSIHNVLYLSSSSAISDFYWIIQKALWLDPQCGVTR